MNGCELLWKSCGNEIPAVEKIVDNLFLFLGLPDFLQAVLSHLFPEADEVGAELHAVKGIGQL